MATRPRIKLRHSPVITYSPAASQGNYVGAQATAGRRGTLPTFTDLNTYYIAKTGADANAGTAAAPKLTLNSLFSTTKDLTSDQSGANNDLTEVGTLPYLTYPCYPKPPQGNYAAGPFSDSNYLRDTGGGLYGALNGATALSVDFWVYCHSLANDPIVFSFNDGTSDNYIQLRSDGTVRFQLNGTNLDSSAGAIVVRTWYYVKCSWASGTTGAKRIYVGASPESATLRNSATQTHTIGVTTDLMIGRFDGGTGYSLNGYIDRVTVTTSNNTDLPTLPSAANLQGYYPMETLPLIQSAPMDYIVIKDSGTYEEALYANFPHEEISYGLYAADGYTPKFKRRIGVFPGTYGAGNSTRAVLTSSASTTCFVSKAGNDGTGTRGNAGLPFLTVQAAINAMTTNGDTVQIQDSGTYAEDLSLGTLNFTLQAAANQVPILTPTTAGTTYHLTLGAAQAVDFSGLLIRSKLSTQTLLNCANYAATIRLYDCTVDSYVVVYGTGSNVPTFTYTDCNFSGCYAFSKPVGGSSYTTAVNCRLYGDATRSIQDNNLTPKLLQNCTFENFDRLYFKTYSNIISTIVDSCDFKEAPIYLPGEAGAAGFRAHQSVVNCKFEHTTTTYPVLLMQAAISQTTSYLLENNLFNLAGDGSGVKFQADGGSAGSFYALDNVILRSYNDGLLISGSANAIQILVEGLTTVACGQHGIESGSGTYRRLLDASSASGAYTGITPTYSTSGASSILGTTEGSENVTPNVGPGLMGGSAERSKDCGYDFALFDLRTDGVVIDGITFDGISNMDAAVRSEYNFDFTLRYCTFNGLGPYAVKASAGATITKCLFYQVNGNALKLWAVSATATYNAFAVCSGIGITNFSQLPTLTNNSTYACLYGQYDGGLSLVTGLRDCIFSQSSIYDYSGESEAGYSCIGTLDPDRANSVAATSIRQDPLYRDPENGDLRLMAEAAGSLFTSPAKGTGTSSADMGAFAFTYGTASTAWTTVDFGTSGYYNPDRVVRNLRPINLSEEDRDDLGLKSSAFGFKLEYQLTWEGMSAMPQAQVTELAAAFSATSNQVQIQLDGSTWLDGYLVRGEGFEYAEEPGYSNDVLPVPLRSLAVRLA